MTKTCCVCYEDLPPNLFSPCSDDCAGNVCETCVTRQVIEQVNAGTSIIHCASCSVNKPNERRSEKSELSLDYLRVVLGEHHRDVLAQLTEIMTLRSLDSENYNCPYPECGALMHIEPTSGKQFNIIRCITCGKKSCYECKSSWHEGYSCDQWKHRETDEARNTKLAEEYLRQNGSKLCPGCRMPTIKNEGCDHMKCFCRQEYNWSGASPF